MLSVLVTRADVEASFRSFASDAVALLPRLALAVVAFVAFVLFARAAREAAKRSTVRSTGDARAGNALGTLTRYVVLFLGFVVALSIAGVSLSAMMIAVGAVGFALAFGMQETIANLVAGLIILTTRPFASEDTVEVNDAAGTVDRISIRATKIKTFDGVKVEVPNRAVLQNNITVFSEHPTRRFDVAVGIGYDDDIEGAVEAAREAAQGIEEVLEDPPVEAFVTELGGSSVDLAVRFWVQRAGRGTMLRIKGEVTRAVKEALDEAGYDIPFPIRTVYLEDGEDEAPASTPEVGRA